MAAEAGPSLLLDLAPPSGHGDVFDLILGRLMLQDLQVSSLQPATGMLCRFLSATFVQALLLSCRQLRSAVTIAPQNAWRSAGEHCELRIPTLMPMNSKQL